MIVDVILRPDDPVAVTVVDAIHGGGVEQLGRLLEDNPGLASARIGPQDCEGDDGISRTMLHVATDWPGHFPQVTDTIRLLVAGGADVDARNTPATETALHWAASSDDVAALDALLDAGADIEAPGAVIAGGTPLDDAVAFAQWQTAGRLVDRGARTELWHAAALGLMDRVEAHLAAEGSLSTAAARHPWGAGAPQPPDALTVAFWCACHGGQAAVADHLLARGADLNWTSVWDGLTPLDAAHRQGAEDLVVWLRGRGAKSADELG